MKNKKPSINRLLRIVIAVLFFAATLAAVGIMILSSVVKMPPGQVLSQLFFLPPYFRLDAAAPSETLSVELLVAEMLTGTSMQQTLALQTQTNIAEEVTEITPTPPVKHIITPALTTDAPDSHYENQTAELCSPIAGVEIDELASIISQPFDVKNPYSDFGHHGVDFGSYDFRGEYLFDVPIQAIFTGRIAAVVHDRPPLGNAVILETEYSELPDGVKTILQIQTGESLYHLYAHLLEFPYFSQGTRVICGETINRLGASQTVEAHLHLELRIGESGQTFGSMAFYDTSATEEEMNEYLLWRTSGEFMPVDPMELFLPPGSE